MGSLVYIANHPCSQHKSTHLEVNFSRAELHTVMQQDSTQSCILKKRDSTIVHT